MKILVTGGAGFIGANLTQRLVAAGDEVVVLDNLTTGKRENISGLDIRFVEGSILDSAALESAAAGVQSMIHLAAIPSVPRSIKDPVRSHHANATGTLLVLEEARRQGAHVAVAGSSSVYGSVLTLPKSEDLPTRPLSPYAASKLAAESYAVAYGTSFDLPTIAFRFFNVYGPLQGADHAYAAVVPCFLDAAIRHAPVNIDGDGLQSRDFTYIDTVTSVLAEAAHTKRASDVPVNLALGTNTTLLELVDLIEAAVGYELIRNHRESRPGDVRSSQADSTRLRSLFPEVQSTTLEHGIEATLGWFRQLPAYR